MQICSVRESSAPAARGTKATWSRRRRPVTARTPLAAISQLPGGSCWLQLAAAEGEINQRCQIAARIAWPGAGETQGTSWVEGGALRRLAGCLKKEQSGLTCTKGPDECEAQNTRLWPRDICGLLIINSRAATINLHHRLRRRHNFIDATRWC